MNRIRPFAFAAALTLLMPMAALPQTQTPPPQAAAAPHPLLVLLEKTGYEYRKAGEGIWVVTLEGKNLKEIDVIIQPADDIVVIQTQVAERKAVMGKPALLVKLLELNHEYDIVKFAFSTEMLYARLDIRARLLDADQLKDLINLVAFFADETSPQLKPFFTVKK